MNDVLTDFMLWFVSQKLSILNPPIAAGTIISQPSVTTMVLFREPPFQVELVILHPNAPWPGEHRHPDVDSFEVALFNCINFTRNGQVVEVPDLLVPVDGRNFQCVRLKPTDFHGIPPLELGGSLLSVQHWIHGVNPSSVGKNWLGLPVNKEHFEILQGPDAKLFLTDERQDLTGIPSDLITKV